MLIYVTLLALHHHYEILDTGYLGIKERFILGHIPQVQVPEGTTPWVCASAEGDPSWQKCRPQLLLPPGLGSRDRGVEKSHSPVEGCLCSDLGISHQSPPLKCPYPRPGDQAFSTQVFGRQSAVTQLSLSCTFICCDQYARLSNVEISLT